MTGGWSPCHFYFLMFKCVVSAVIFLYSLLHIGQFTCVLAILMHLSLCLYAMCLARLIDVFAVFVQFAIQH